MVVEVEVLEFGYSAVIRDNNRFVGEMLGVTLANLYRSLYEVYGIDLYGNVSLN